MHVGVTYANYTQRSRHQATRRDCPHEHFGACIKHNTTRNMHFIAAFIIARPCHMKKSPQGENSQNWYMRRNRLPPCDKVPGVSSSHDEVFPCAFEMNAAVSDLRYQYVGAERYNVCARTFLAVQLSLIRSQITL